MKRALLIFISLILAIQLTGCFGGGDDDELAGVVRQKFKSFTVDIPSDWSKINSADFANTIPEETVAIFLKRTTGDDFIQNVNVVKESINTDASSLEYAKANLLLGSKAIVDYRATATEEVNVNGINTVQHNFRARNTTTDPLRNYTQTYFVKDRVGYTVTCIAKEDDILQQSLCDGIVKSFAFTQ